MDNDVLPSFAAEMRTRALAETTIRNRTGILRAIRAHAGRSLLEVDIHDLRDYFGRPGIKASSRRTEQVAAASFFTFAVDEGLRDDDPSTRLKAVHVPRGEPRPFSSEQIDRMLTSGAYTKTRAMILLGFYQGFRVSSIARVHGEDIDLEEMTIRTIGKGSKERILPLHPVIADLARSMPRRGWWFPARRGEAGHIKPSSVTGLVSTAKRRAGIEDPTLTAHSLRHAFGTELVEQGVDIRIIQELMMHESLASTQIYTGVSTRLKRDGIRALPHRDVPRHSGRSEALAA